MKKFDLEMLFGYSIADKEFEIINSNNIENGYDAISKLYEHVDFLLGKSRAYNDTDFRNEAIKLVGEKEVVMRTIYLNLPLWNEDKEYIGDDNLVKMIENLGGDFYDGDDEVLRAKIIFK